MWITTSLLHHLSGDVGDMPAALAALERARACPEPPDDPVRLDVLHGSVLCRLGRHVEAVPMLERAYRGMPAPPAWLCLDLGVGLRNVPGRAADAVEPLRRAVASGQLGSNAHFNLAGALRACDRREEALVEFGRARAAPDYGGYYGHLREGETLLELDRPAEALPLLEEGLARGGPEAATNPQLLAAVAQALVRTGVHARGLDLADRALALDERWLRAHAARVEALLRLGRRDEARAALKAGLALEVAAPDLLELAAELER